MRKLLLLSIAILLCFSLVGCPACDSNSTDNGDGTSNGTDDNGDIIIPGWDTSDTIETPIIPYG